MIFFRSVLLALHLATVCHSFTLETPVPRRLTALGVDGQGMAGGTQHLLGDVIRALQPRYLSQVKDAIQSNMKGMLTVRGDEFCSLLESQIPTWQELESQLPSKSKQNDSVSTASSTIRLFGRSETPIVTLYRDSAAWCPYCQKVWIALEEKQIPHEVVKIDMRCYGKGKPSEFLKLQPNGNLPCSIIKNGDQEKIVRESNDIIDELDGLSALLKPAKTPTLRPTGREDDIRDLCDNGRDSLERRLYTRWMYLLTGVRRPEEYKELFDEHWQEMEDALGKDKTGPYFLGQFSVVDIRFIPFVERQLASLAYFKGSTYLRDPKRYPNIVKWLEAMESRPSYQASKSDYYTHSRSLPPQLAADCFSAVGQCEEMQVAIDDSSIGDGKSGWIEPGWQWYNERHSGIEAAAKLIEGNSRIVGFSARGAGVAGFPAASAPLADPAAKPNESIIPVLDILLRYVASSLLSGMKTSGPSFFSTGSPPTPSQKVMREAISTLDIETIEAAIRCLNYLRARVGVPRDMKYPAAQALRLELVRTIALIQKGYSVESDISAEMIVNER